jgi:hypothetical protein
MQSPAPDAVNAYMALLEQAILNLRMRLRYGEEISADEVHDYLDALHNVPIMLRNYGGWHVEQNIEDDLAQYDQRWLDRPGSQLRKSLVETLRSARAGEFDLPPWNG